MCELALNISGYNGAVYLGDSKWCIWKDVKNWAEYNLEYVIVLAFSENYWGGNVLV